MFHIESLKGRDHIKGYVYQRYFFGEIIFHILDK